MYHMLDTISELWNWSMQNLIYINIILSIIIVFFQRRDPKAVWTWLLVLYFIPIFGFIFYLVLCQDFHKGKMFRVKEIENQLWFSVRKQEKYLKNMDVSLKDPLSRDYADLVYYNLETSGAVLTVDNTVEVFTDGVKKFADLKEEIKQASHYIHIQYYIIKYDELFESLIPLLIEKSHQGVEVRILYDGMGGRFMPKRIWNQLQREGIKVGEFFPALLGRLHLRINYRNHRKIVVIDGKVGYVGGFNIGKEYISKDPKFGYWRDTHLKLTGGSVISLQIRFALDWHYAVKENLFKYAWYFGQAGENRQDLTQSAYNQNIFPVVDLDSDQTPLGIQVIASGPDTNMKQIRNNYIELFYKAKHHIYIQTPYFVPDDAVLTALKIAAMSGVDVRLMIPCMPDHPFVYWATYSYVGDLLEAGARCYTYENGFLHAKGVMIDGRVCSYGTANMDIRSFELNFEVNAVIFDEETTEQLETIFRTDLDSCKEVTRERYINRSWLIRMKEQCSRLLSPLL